MAHPYFAPVRQAGAASPPLSGADASDSAVAMSMS
jgi:hypothetical protein